MFELDRVIFIPASHPPHKSGADITSFDQRIQMVRLAIQDNAFFDVSDLENRRPGKSYSIDTVASFRRRISGKGELFFLVGQDAFLDIQTWKNWERLLSMCHFVVMTRPGYGNREPAEILPAPLAGVYRYDAQEEAFRGSTGHAVFFRGVTFLDISSSDIRQRAAQGRSFRYLVPDKVSAYIHQSGLYRACGTKTFMQQERHHIRRSGPGSSGTAR